MVTRVVVYSAPWSRDASVLRERLASSFPTAALTVVDSSSAQARGIGLRTLPSVHVWAEGRFLGQLTGDISQRKMDGLMAGLPARTEPAGSLASLRSDLVEAMEQDSVHTVSELLPCFRRLVETQMRGGSADPEDIRLLATLDLYQLMQIEAENKSRLIRRFLGGHVESSLDEGLTLYGDEFASFDPWTLTNEQPWESDTRRPFRRILELMMKSMGPLHPVVVRCRASLESLLDRKATTPVIPKRVRIRSGGLPRRQLDGKWSWEGPHWSVFNKNQTKTGHASSLFDRIGA